MPCTFYVCTKHVYIVIKSVMLCPANQLAHVVGDPLQLKPLWTYSITGAAVIQWGVNNLILGPAAKPHVHKEKVKKPQGTNFYESVFLM